MEIAQLGETHHGYPPAYAQKSGFQSPRSQSNLSAFAHPFALLTPSYFCRNACDRRLFIYQYTFKLLLTPHQVASEMQVGVMMKSMAMITFILILRLLRRRTVLGSFS